MRKVIRLIFLSILSSGIGCSAITGTGDLSPLSPTSTQAKIVVDSQFTFIRNISLALITLNAKPVQDSFTAVVDPGSYEVVVRVADANNNPAGTDVRVYITAQPGHTYVIKPLTIGLGGPLQLLVEDRYKDSVVTHN